ncbi:hypothetical protein OH799_22320 [Nocardia sp. NBC_00881]|uniref:hypothetical protein n=1 Tax=Nocardia sp. NBC_00881 TaxID=2975995 RepID=UPI003868A1CF|nr:hypothetical protein OH799_22320 [Nocardia sp. NBC_00881]
MQLMWRGEDWDYDCIQVFWRRTADVTDALAVPFAEFDDPRAENRCPRPCILDPERVLEYPWYEELPDEVLERLQSWKPDSEEDEDPADEKDTQWVPPSLYYQMSTAPGFKVGGSMSWSTTDMPDLVCSDCGAPSTLLLHLDTYEWAPGRSASRWRPLEDRHLLPGTPDYELACEPTGLTIGSATHGGVFICSASPEHAAKFRCQ